MWLWNGGDKQAASVGMSEKKPQNTRRLREAEDYHLQNESSSLVRDQYTHIFTHIMQTYTLYWKNTSVSELAAQNFSITTMWKQIISWCLKTASKWRSVWNLHNIHLKWNFFFFIHDLFNLHLRSSASSRRTERMKIKHAWNVFGLREHGHAQRNTNRYLVSSSGTWRLHFILRSALRSLEL